MERILARLENFNCGRMILPDEDDDVREVCEIREINRALV